MWPKKVGVVSRAYPDEMPIDDTEEQNLRVARDALDIACVSTISGLLMASWQEFTHHPSLTNADHADVVLGIKMPFLSLRLCPFRHRETD